MFKERSKMLFVATILATLYTIYLVSYFTGAVAETSSDAEAVGAGIATMLVAPHMFMMGLGALFGWLGFSLKANWGALVAAILYSVGAFLFIPYIMFGAPILIFGFIGFANQKKIKKRIAEENKE